MARLAAALLATATAAAVGGCGAGRAGSSGVAARGSDAERLVLVRGGLLADHPLTGPGASSTLGRDFRLGGTAAPTNRHVQFGTDGLRVAVGARRGWAGFYAATSATYPADAVFRVRMSRPEIPVHAPGASGIALFAIQTAASPLLNYVLVADVVSRRGRFWIVGHAIGDTAHARTTDLWSTAGGPAAEDITVQTDGRRSLTVRFGHRLVYRSHSLTLRATPPLRAYLEVEARQVAYSASFQNLQVTAGSAITVAGLRPGARVSLTRDRAAAAVVSASANQTGSVSLPLPLPDVVGRGTLAIAGAGATRRFRVAYAGGDAFRLLR